MALFFEIFACMRACTARHAPCAQNTIKTDAKRISANQRATQKTSKVRFKTLSNRAFYKDCAKNSSFGSQGLVLKGSGSLLGNSWAPLGWLLAALGGSCSLWAASGASLGRLWGALGCILTAEGGLGLNFGRFGDVSDWVGEALGSMFWHVFSCASPLSRDAWIAAVNTFSRRPAPRPFCKTYCVLRRCSLVAGRWACLRPFTPSHMCKEGRRYVRSTRNKCFAYAKLKF